MQIPTPGKQELIAPGIYDILAKAGFFLSVSQSDPIRLELGSKFFVRSTDLEPQLVYQVLEDKSGYYFSELQGVELEAFEQLGCGKVGTVLVQEFS